jgi:hypothetical protein
MWNFQDRYSSEGWFRGWGKLRGWWTSNLGLYFSPVLSFAICSPLVVAICGLNFHYGTSERQIWYLKIRESQRWKSRNWRGVYEFLVTHVTLGMCGLSR